MKKIKVILAILVVAMAVASASCNRKLCPAYTKANIEQAQRG